MPQLARRDAVRVDDERPRTAASASAELSSPEIERLSRAAGFAVDTFKPSHLAVRVARVAGRYGVRDVDALAARMQADPAVRAAVRRSIAISVTGFFRDAEQFETLDPHLRALGSGRRLRVWSAGCSTGEELWTLAVVLTRRGMAESAQLLGSDLLEENVREARRPRRADELGGAVLPSATRLRFETRDIASDGPPGNRWDLVVCRNMAIYLEPGARARVHAMLCACLAPGGLLLLGRSERLSSPRDAGMDLVGPHLYRKLTP